jgi:hypothetical protein
MYVPNWTPNYSSLFHIRKARLSSPPDAGGWWACLVQQMFKMAQTPFSRQVMVWKTDANLGPSVAYTKRTVKRVMRVCFHDESG